MAVAIERTIHLVKNPKAHVTKNADLTNTRPPVLFVHRRRAMWDSKRNRLAILLTLALKPSAATGRIVSTGTLSAVILEGFR